MLEKVELKGIRSSEYELVTDKCFDVHSYATLCKIMDRNKNNLIVLYFYSEYCSVCEKNTNHLKKLNGSNLILCKLNMKDDRLFSYKFKVSEVPTIILVKRNSPIYKFVGELGKHEIQTIKHFAYNS